MIPTVPTVPTVPMVYDDGGAGRLVADNPLFTGTDKEHHSKRLDQNTLPTLPRTRTNPVTFAHLAEPAASRDNVAPRDVITECNIHRDAASPA